MVKYCQWKKLRGSLLMNDKKSIAFICVHNSCRSQIAEALAKRMLTDYDVYSAGTELKNEINSDAVRLMKQYYHIDMTETQYPKLLSEIPSHIDYVITMGCGVACPALPCQEMQDWGLMDPTGSSDEVFMEVIREIERKIKDFKVDKE